MTVEELIAKAYEHDREGREREAIKLYDQAWKAGVPEGARKRFLVGYGSTLRNVGRAEDAVAILGEAVAAYPDYPALVAFLALALAEAGHPKAALATMLGCALDCAKPGVFDGYERALTEYHRELLERASS
jgi:tetratricopeptide (TPR) repeat protein